MTESPTCFSVLIDALGGAARVAEVVHTDPAHVRVMKQRDSIAPEHWPALETAAADAGLAVDASDFARWRAEKARDRKVEAEAT